MTDNIKNISVTLAGRTYPLLTTEEEETVIKQINSQLEKEFTTMQQRYASKLNKQDVLAMLLFTYAKNLYDSNQKHDMSGIERRIIDIEELLDLAFDKED